MPIGTSDGQTYQSELDQLLQVKDMPSREETDRQQKMKDMESTMPYDMRGPPPPTAPTERNQLDPSVKDQNDPYAWGMGSSMDRTGPAMVPLPELKFHEIMNQLDEIISPSNIPTNAR